MKKLRIPDNLTTLAYRTIRSYIWDGKLDEGDRLTEEFLAQSLGISKSPIREALNRLESEGLIHIEPRKGAYLIQYTPDEVADLYEVREALEVHAVATAIIDAELTRKLTESLSRMKEYFDANDKRRYIDEDVAFHSLIAESTRNQRLLKMLENIQQQVWLFRRRTYDLTRSMAMASHSNIVGALEAGDKKAAELLMRKHISGVKETLVESLRAAEFPKRRQAVRA